MAESNRNTPQSDYLTRLAGLAVGHTVLEPGDTEQAQVLLRPRLPSRFEDLPDTAAEDPFWGELESESVPRDETAMDEYEGSRPQRASVRQSPTPPRATREPGPLPRQTRDSETLRRGAVVNTPTVRPDAGSSNVPERRSPTSLTAPPTRIAAQASALTPEIEIQAPTAEAAPRISNPVRIDRSSSPAETSEAHPTRRDLHSRTADEVQDQQRSGLPRTTLRPVPPPPPPPRDEPHRADAYQRIGGERRQRDLTEADEHRPEPMPPVINVTIGRIEVRAPITPATPSLPRPEPPRPAMSLEEYLQRRSDGRY